ncbi:MAG: hypothetical protein PV340_02850 [Wolbachia sp.]|nr:hypothetical protein [Wolbachia sp.]MDD9335883.1 hypothetical protein [Wolbachia sp.]
MLNETIAEEPTAVPAISMVQRVGISLGTVFGLTAAACGAIAIGVTVVYYIYKKDKYGVKTVEKNESEGEKCFTRTGRKKDGEALKKHRILKTIAEKKERKSLIIQQSGSREKLSSNNSREKDLLLSYDSSSQGQT